MANRRVPPEASYVLLTGPPIADRPLANGVVIIYTSSLQMQTFWFSYIYEAPEEYFPFRGNAAIHSCPLSVFAACTLCIAACALWVSASRAGRAPPA